MSIGRSESSLRNPRLVTVTAALALRLASSAQRNTAGFASARYLSTRQQPSLTMSTCVCIQTRDRGSVARKRKKDDLRGMDSKSLRYWEELLQRNGLQMAAGRSDRLSYVGGASQVETIHGLHTQDDGRVVPDGEGPQ